MKGSAFYGKAPMKFNKGLKAASASGKLDKNPKFKAAVDGSPVEMYDAPGKMYDSPTKMKSPAKKKGIYKTFLDADGNEKNKRITREEADKIKGTETILETGSDITVDKPEEIINEGDYKEYKRKVAAQEKRIAKEKKLKASKKVPDLETGKMITTAEDKKKQAAIKKA